MGVQERITLIIYTRGGHTLAGWSIANLIRMFCNEFEIIIPSKAHSTGTLIALSANHIIMTKQATLGPIDPSVNGPLNPQMPGAPVSNRVPISVEAVAGYFSLAKNELGIWKKSQLALALQTLSNTVHPLALGNVYRSRTQIKMLATKLLQNHSNDKRNMKRIIAFMCSDSGSHDYTINRREAEKDLGLPIKKPTNDEYHLIKKLYDDLREELKLNEPLDYGTVMQDKNDMQYSFTRGLIESISGGSHKFITNGTLSKVDNKINNTVIFQGWKHEK